MHASEVLHLQPPDDRSQRPHDKTKAQQISRRALESCLAVLTRQAGLQEGCRKGGAIAILVAPTSTTIHPRRLATSLCAGVLRQT
jgi:hypothetical protein